jgi:hypothetical protein
MDQQELQKARQAVDAEITTEIAKLPLPAMDRAMEVQMWVAKALMGKSPDEAGLHYRDYKNICQKPIQEWNFTALGAALNVVSSCSPTALGCVDHASYFDIMDYVGVIAKQWNEAAAPVKDGIIRKHETRLKISAGIGSKTIKLGN